MNSPVLSSEDEEEVDDCGVSESCHIKLNGKSKGKKKRNAV